ncbi:ATJ2 [Symbiodinium sp. KB8]|nr:ATJ2 [Symbiodinium sp. KB8]
MSFPGGILFVRMGGGGGFPFPGGFPGGMPHMHGHSSGGSPGNEEPERDVDTTKLYEALGVDKQATKGQIKKAYLKLARTHHPDKGGDPDQFKIIQAAYDILSDEEKRSLYDRGGLDAVEKGDGGDGPADIFEALFGGGRRGPRGPRKGDPTVHPIRVSLEDVYKGKTVRLAVTKTLYEKDPAGNVMDNMGNRYNKRNERKVLTVDIEQGVRDGHRITFEGEGDVIPGQLPGDVIFVVKTKEHETFQRKGADLIMKKEISLLEALTGVEFLVQHLDEHKVLVKSTPGEVVQHEAIKQIEGEGMPIYGNTFMRGCLFIQFDVKMPETLVLTDAQKAVLRGVLPGPPPAAPIEVDELTEEKLMTDVDLEARRAREQLGKDAAADSDEEGGGPGGMRAVQCAQS